MALNLKKSEMKIMHTDSQVTSHPSGLSSLRRTIFKTKESNGSIFLPEQNASIYQQNLSDYKGSKI